MSAASALSADPQGGGEPLHNTWSGNRLPRSARIPHPSIFRQAFDHGAHAVGRTMVMWLRSGEDASLRVGVIASKRTFRRAVDRARAKRLLRESFRLNRSVLVGHADIVLVARRRILSVNRHDVDREFLALARKLGLSGSGGRKQGGSV